MRDIVCPAIGREEEGGNAGVAGVVGGCYIVFEEVEEGEGGEEEWDTPKGRFKEAEDNGEGDGEAEGRAN